jgi:sensor histidine kinase YesM
MKLPIILHLLAWITYITLVLATEYLSGKTMQQLTSSFLLLLEGAALFYLLVLLVLPRLLTPRRYGALALALLACLVQHLLLHYAIRITPGAAHQPFYDNTLPELVPALPAFFFYLLVAGCYHHFIRVRQREHSWRITAAQYEHAQREGQQRIERLQSDNAFLRASISPHFLFNTLAFVYNKVSPSSAQAAEQVVVLSNLMRYSIKIGDVDGMVSLQEEADHILSLIQIHQLRYAHGLKIETRMAERLGGLRIIPHLLTSQAEHALKYADLSNEKHPLCIELTAQNQEAHFTIRFRKRNGPPELGFTIGPEEIRKRLEIDYPGRHNFAATEDAFSYQSELLITLTK